MTPVSNFIFQLLYHSPRGHSFLVWSFYQWISLVYQFLVSSLLFWPAPESFRCQSGLQASAFWVDLVRKEKDITKWKGVGAWEGIGRER